MSTQFQNFDSITQKIHTLIEEKYVIHECCNLLGINFFGRENFQVNLDTEELKHFNLEDFK